MKTIQSRLTNQSFLRIKMNRLILSTLNRFMGQTANKAVQVALKKVTDKAQTAIETTPMDTHHSPGTSQTVKMARHLGKITGKFLG